MSGLSRHAAAHFDDFSIVMVSDQHAPAKWPDYLMRLATLARVCATGLRQHDADDLLNEALDRVLVYVP